MRVLHCIPTMAGGGAERQLSIIAPLIASMGHDIHVASLRGGVFLDRLIDGGVTVHRLAAYGNHDPLLIPRLVRLARRIRPDVIQTWLTQMDVFGGTAALLARIPWVISERSSALGYPKSLKNRLRAFLGRRASAVASNSAGGDDYWRTQGMKSIRKIIPNAVAPELASVAPADPASAGLDPSLPLIVFAGRMSPEKNVGVLLEALERVLPSVPAAAILCGDGPLLAETRARAASLIASHQIAVAGFCSDVWSWIRRADVLVSVSTYEGSPNSVIEAMTLRVPVVVSDIPAHRNLFSDGSAFFADAKSPESVAEAICDALRDRERARRHAELATALVAQWSPAAVAEDFLSLYSAVLEAR